MVMRTEEKTSRLALALDCRAELWCSSCGYGIVVASPPNRCPMCRIRRWVPAAELPGAARGIRVQVFGGEVSR